MWQREKNEPVDISSQFVLEAMKQFTGGIVSINQAAKALKLMNCGIQCNCMNVERPYCYSPHHFKGTTSNHIKNMYPEKKRYRCMYGCGYSSDDLKQIKLHEIECKPNKESKKNGFKNKS